MKKEMKHHTKTRYVAPTMTVVHLHPEGETCQTVPVYYSTAGPGVAGVRQGAFLDDEEINDNIWESAFMEKKD